MKSRSCVLPSCALCGGNRPASPFLHYPDTHHPFALSNLSYEYLLHHHPSSCPIYVVSQTEMCAACRARCDGAAAAAPGTLAATANLVPGNSFGRPMALCVTGPGAATVRLTAGWHHLAGLPEGSGCRIRALPDAEGAAVENTGSTGAAGRGAAGRAITSFRSTRACTEPVLLHCHCRHSRGGSAGRQLPARRLPGSRQGAPPVRGAPSLLAVPLPCCPHRAPRPDPTPPPTWHAGRGDWRQQPAVRVGPPEHNHVRGCLPPCHAVEHGLASSGASSGQQQAPCALGQRARCWRQRR